VQRWRFRVVKPKMLPVWVLGAVILVALALLYELYLTIIPFHSRNPLWHEVTVDQPVIGDWLYGGQTEGGYLKFYNHSGSVVIPPSSHTFDADGKFVVIEHYTPSTLTFAEPYGAIPLRWIALTIAVLLALPLLILWRFKALHKRRLKANPRHANRMSSFIRHIPSSAQPSKKRFKPRRRLYR
jgi:hypothetical protein